MSDDVTGMEDSSKYNDRRMSSLTTGPFKPSTQKTTVRSLDMMIPAVDQWLGEYTCHRMGWLLLLLLLLLLVA